MKFTIDGVNFSVDEVTGVLSFEGGEIKNAMAADMLIAALTRFRDLHYRLSDRALDIEMDNTKLPN